MEEVYHIIIWYNLIMGACVFMIMMAIRRWHAQRPHQGTPGGKYWSASFAIICLSSILSGIERLSSKNYDLTHGSIVFAIGMTVALVGWIKTVIKDED